MRGLAGIVRFDGSPAEPAEVSALLQSMAVGPTDRVSQQVEGDAGFGHLLEFFWAGDELETQPLRSADGQLLCVTDALLDNREELAAAFGWSAADAAGRADSAFVLAAFERWGDGCAARLEGKFALAVWQRRERRLFLAVDQFGHRPLYYWRRGRELVFATTLRGLFALPRIARELDEDVLAAYVARIDPESLDATLYRDVKRVPGGHGLQLTAAGGRATRYWNPDTTRELRLSSDAEYLEAFRAELERAVHTSFRRGPRQTGVLLSGGLDSAAVTAFAGRQLAAQGRRLQALHLVPPVPNRVAGLRELDESRHVEAMRGCLPDVDFHLVPNEPAPLQPDERTAWFEDNWIPCRHLAGRGPNPGTALLDRLDVGVLLEGGGGNYLVSPECLATDYLSHLLVTGRWGRLATEFRGLCRVYGHAPAALFRRALLSPLKQALLPPRPPGPGHPLYLLQPDVRRRTRIEERLRAHLAAWASPPRDYRARLGRVLTEVARQQVGAAPAVIQRGVASWVSATPMLDRRLNEFCLSLPPAQQIRDGWDRRLLRETNRGSLPDSVRLRLTRGFPHPAFQSLWNQTERHLRQELVRLQRTDAATRYLDLTRLSANPKPGTLVSPEGQRRLIDAVAIGCFLDWHDRQSHLR